MTAKRFTIEKKYWKTLPQGDYLKDNLTGESEFGLEKFCEIGNELQKENEQLKNENAKMKKELSLLAEFNQKAIL